MEIKFQTSKGSAILGESLSVLKNVKFIEKYKNKVQLILTSPPFPLVNKKKYGNLNGKEYINWIKSYAKPFHNILKDDGSLVIEIGNKIDVNTVEDKLFKIKMYFFDFFSFFSRIPE